MATLECPYHDRVLNLCLVHEDCGGLGCKWCDCQILGPAYVCVECEDLFLHKSCAELPTEIQHPSHREHPLKWYERRVAFCDACKSLQNVGFDCSECKTGFCAGCIAATMPDGVSHTRPVDESTAPHVAHQHPLASFRVARHCRIKCGLCKNRISGDVYGCYECSLFMHKSCAESPQEVRHPFHPQHPLTLLIPGISDVSDDSICSICGQKCCESIYSCTQCEFNLDFRCATSTIEFPISEDSALFINHFAHPDQLKYFHAKVKSRIPCKACGENISGEAYGCSGCLFFLHKSCTQLPETIEHPLHGEHSLALLPTSPDDSASLRCFICDDSITSYALAFSCQKCGFVLDVKCALGTLDFLKQGGSAQIKHDLHDHPLQLVYLNDGVVDNCCACTATVEGLAYFCRSDSDFLIHRSCAELPSEMQHPAHAQHTVTLHHGESYYTCSVCFKYNTGSRFRCERCDFHSDLPCAFHPTFKHPLHKHNLSHFAEIGGSFPCKACDKSCNVDIYRCLQCNFFIHSDCLPKLPPKIKHKFHLHQLTFADSFVGNDYGDYYCDFCPQTRNPELGAYYCEECPRQDTVTAHIECAVSADMDLADTVRKIVKSENRAIARLDEEIASLKAQEDELNKKLDVVRKELQRLKLEHEAALLGGEEQKHEQQEEDEEEVD